MYMERIVAAQIQAKTPTSPVLRMAVGLPILLLGAAVMLPWLVLNAVWVGVTLVVRGLPRAARALVQIVDYAGSVALGR